MPAPNSPAAAPLFQDLSGAAQTNFAELVEQARAAMVQRSIQDVSGSFNKKVLKGAAYWYWQYRDLSGANRQVYLGPDDDRLQRLMQQHKEGKTVAATNLAQLAGACGSLGCMPLLPVQHYRVIHRLAEHGFFRAGGVLVGTHAFLAMSNMLGVRWASGWRTQDIDFAHPGKNVSIALAPGERLDVNDAITTLAMGLLPANSLTTGPGATYLTTRHDLRVDFLTVAGRAADTYKYEPLNVYLQPLKFMEFSLEEPVQTAVFADEGAVLVNIPAPMRYALHKLVVMAEREESFRPKLQKDAAQIAALVAFGLERTPHALERAAKDIMSRGKGWRTRIGQGLRQLAVFHPDTAAALTGVLGVDHKT